MRARVGLVVVATIVMTLAACVFRDVAVQQRKMDALCVLSGTVQAERAADRPIVVLLVRREGTEPVSMQNISLSDHFVREGDGRWLFAASPGTYGLAAFEDTNRDLVYEPGEPFLRMDTGHPIDCSAGTRIEDIALVIPEDGKPGFEGALDIAALRARTPDDQIGMSLGSVTAVGEVATLDDPRFSETQAQSGLWRPFDFLFDARPGVYFLDTYDPAKVPVLFIHGINGTPRNFRALIDGLDHKHFQPWVYYYPSGVHLDTVSSHLVQTIAQLERLYEFDKLIVVAHSMGGLVARSFVLKRDEENGRAEIPLFITLATPWDGQQSAALGVERAPAVVRSWIDMAPGSTYLTNLFYIDGTETRRLLPNDVSYHLLFAFRRRRVSFGPSDDQVVTVASQMRPEAQQEARRLYGFDETHASILTAPAVSTLVNALLDDAVR